MQNHGCACWCTFLLDYVSPAVFVWLSHVLLLTLALNWHVCFAYYCIYCVCIAHVFKTTSTGTCCNPLCSLSQLLLSAGLSFFCWALNGRYYDRSIWCAIGLWCHCFGHLQTGPLGIRHPVFLLTHACSFLTTVLTTVGFIVTYIII